MSSSEILEDGKNDWKNKKVDNLIIAESYKRLWLKYDINNFININYNMINCASMLEFKLFEDNTKKLNKAMFCRNRLCPMCNWRRSKKIFGQVSKIVQEIDKLDKYNYIFLTLTLKNCTSNELEENINLISSSFMNMFRGNKKIKNICKGYFRAIEVTFNKKENTYHPHIHCIIVVDKNYFNRRNKDYIKIEEWQLIWQYYLKVDYLPICDVRKVKLMNYKAVAEVSKYTVKSKDIIIYNQDKSVNEKLTDDNIYNLHFTLRNKRLVSFGGIFKEYHKKLNFEDINKNDIDLIKTDVDDNDELLNYIIVKYGWNVGLTNYILTKN